MLLRRWAPGDALPLAAAGAASRIGAGLVLLGASFSLSGVITLMRARTTTLPFRAAARLVAHGPYRFARNPMYTGLTAVYLGAALVTNRLWPLCFLPVVIWLLIRFVVSVEERYLEARFGEAYRSYKARVRRFLIA
jgi:protein-S-isoprenylcysteine O-methyltransferase Ste14